jgi:GntR family transcriptional regulator
MKRAKTSRSIEVQPPQHAEVLSRSRQPLYLQLAAEVRRNIAQGIWAQGAQIPSLEALMRDYQVARMTLRNAISMLVSEGLVRRGRGLGTFVEEKIPSVTELQLPTTWEETVALSDLLGTQSIFESDRAIETLPELGMYCAGQPVISYRHLCRLHVKDGVPYCFSEVYLDEDLFKKHRAAFKKSAAASVIARIPNLKLSEARQKITINGAGLNSAKALNLSAGDSVAEVRRFAGEDGKIIYFARLEFPTKFVKLEFDLLSR